LNLNGGYLGVSRPTIYELQFLFSGSTFSWVKQITIPGSSTLDLQIVVGKDKFVHLTCRHIITYAPLISITVNENATFAIGVTTSPVFNSKYSSNVVPTIEIYTDSTLTGVGTILEDIFLIPLLEWNQAEPEFILDQEMSYAIRITNGSLTAQVVDFNWVWYESDNTHITLGPASNLLNFSAETLNPIVINVAQKVYYGYNFDGSNTDYIQIPRTTTIEPTAAITVECRTRLNTIVGLQATATPRIIHKYSDTFAIGYEYFTRATQGTVVSRLVVGVTVIEQIFNITSWDTNIIHHLATTYDGANVIFYVDGVARVTTPIVGTISHNTRDLYFGIYENGGPVFLGYEGFIDEVRIWDVARSQPQISANMMGSVDPNSSNLVGYWKLDEISGVTAFNALNNGTNDGVINGTTREVISYHPDSAVINFTLPVPTVTNV